MNPFEYLERNVIKPEYKGYVASSHYVEMRDKVKIAVEVLLPKKISEGKKVPAILIQTRYWRAIELKKPIEWLFKFATNPLIAKNLPQYGYAVVVTDVRGCGASYGNRKYPVSPEEVKDGKEVIDWIVSQEWSNGDVVSWGNSYTGMTAEMTATLHHPSLKAIITKHNPWDLYRFAMFPGGVFNSYFIKYWSSLGEGLDTTKGDAMRAFKPFEPLLGTLGPIVVKGVKPVGDSREYLEEVAEIHKKNKHPYDYGERVIYRDDPADEDGTTINDLSIFTHLDEIEESNIPLYTWGSWMDSGTADFVLSRFFSLNNPVKAIIGDWDHNGIKKANPYISHKDKVLPNKDDQIKDWINFYNFCLAGSTPEKELYYYTMGEEKWKTTDKWPPHGCEMIKWYLQDDNELSTESQENPSGEDKYKVDYSVTTGIRNRWYTLLSLRIIYDDRKEQDAKSLVYTSKPLEEDIEITGHPIVNLFLSTDKDDGMVHTHLEFLDENDEIHWITDGQLRFLHRKVSTETPPYKIFVPYHTFERKDGLPVTPQEPMSLKFGMFPTSLIVKKGYKLRFVITGADKDSFARYPEEGIPTLAIQRNAQFPSHIELPIIKK